eukprot:Gb_15337 [translate_table: standard]
MVVEVIVSPVISMEVIPSICGRIFVSITSDIEVISELVLGIGIQYWAIPTKPIGIIPKVMYWVIRALIEWITIRKGTIQECTMGIGSIIGLVIELVGRIPHGLVTIRSSIEGIRWVPYIRECVIIMT